MPSILNASTTGKPFLVCLANLLLLLLLLLGPSGVRGASLRDHRPRGGEQDGRQAPNADMLKALEYIESLRQRTDSRQRAPLSVAAATAGRLDDAEKLRGVLRLAANPPQEEEDEGREDKSEELLQAVLSTLQQTERASSPAGLRPSSPAGLRPSSPAGLRPSLLGGGGQRRQHGITPHRKLPLMFEDEEEGEGDEDGDEDKDGDGAEREIPFKRTKENLEEKYTPQNLATLQSVFDELDKLTGAKSAHKRQEEEDAAEEEEEDGDGVFNVRNVAYDDLAEWGPLQERDEEDDDDDDEEEEEEEDDGEGRQEFDRGLDYVDDAGEEDEGRYPLGTSKLPDDATNLMDYYLLRVLEKTEEEEQKRAVEEEEEEEEEERRAERRAASTQHRDGVDPQAVYQLIQISQKYQIPPGDLLDMLKTTGRDEPAKGGGSARYDPPRAAPKRTHKAAEANLHDRRLLDRQKTPEELRTEEILDILGLGSAEDGERAPARKRKQHGSSAPTPRRLPSKLKDDYDDGGEEEDADEDELAAYLAARMLEQYRGTPYGGGGGGNMASQKRGSYEEAIHSYFDGMDSEKSENEKRRSEQEERGYEDEALMKLMSYLNPETEESENDAKSSQGI